MNRSSLKTLTLAVFVLTTTVAAEPRQQDAGGEAAVRALLDLISEPGWSESGHLRGPETEG